MNLGLEGRAAIVCGASAGMGLAIAESLTAERVRLVMFANEEDELRAEAEKLGAVAVPGDLREADDLERVVETTLTEFGGIDILINNGGGPRDLAARDVSDDDLAAALDLTLYPVVRLTRLCLPHLECSGHGRIVTIASSSVREPIDGLALSNLARPAVVGWLKTLLRELGSSGVTVNAIAPGRIETRTFLEFYETRSKDEDLAQIPLGRFGSPREVGDLVCFLCSDRAAYLTGALIPIDGGLTRCFL
jgi:3-oxoacyl-[acyl-carrier protein] reductase